MNIISWYFILKYYVHTVVYEYSNSSTKCFNFFNYKPLFLEIINYLNIVFHIRSLHSFIIIDRCDDQWT